MILAVGLGNPGKKFEKTRHNVGFRAIDKIAANFQLSSRHEMKKSKRSSPPIFNFQSIFNAQISKGEISGQKVILAKPQTFMNNSGRAVKLLTRNYKLKAENLFIVHDDIDLPFGKIRISAGRSAAGHKGVESIIRELKTKDFVRFRVGIKPEKGDEDKSSSSPFAIARVIENRKQKIEKFVLEKFNKNEEKKLGGVIKEAVEAIEMAIKEGTEKTMNEYNK